MFGYCLICKIVIMGLKNLLEKEREGRKLLFGGDWKWFCLFDIYFKCVVLCCFFIVGFMVWFIRVCFFCLYEVCLRCRNIYENSCKYIDFLFIYFGCIVFEWIIFFFFLFMICGRLEYSKSLLIVYCGYVIWLLWYLVYWNWNRVE